MKKYIKGLRSYAPKLADQQVVKQSDAFLPFALTDVLTAEAGENNSAIIHFWEFEQTVILGMKDSRLLYFPEALNYLTKQEYHPMLRSSGGLGIVADQGVLNISFILPNFPDNKLNIQQGYEFAVQIVKQVFSDFPVTIEAREISDSYCPGSYDLSIDGKKFAGLAQRRIKNGISVMLYLSVSGNQKKRGELMANFYHAGLKEAFGTNGFPPVNPDTMENLNTLLKTSFSMTQLKEKFSHVFQNLFDLTLDDTYLETMNQSKKFNQSILNQLERMENRNAAITDILGGDYGKNS
ncbi:lipoate--protein ligase family protein [Vagococcus elongatus]|uniref:BPL/LPL catalytic domain-containing protein n=1 Tax=Vagococcus elongatus TaxID=180344 RepID=A0A430ANN5_9ENTE|nr:lipoate--protein ligase family protein [Vagococcus elongatus]RSU09709.1 hypothetical protein CBF29_11070 [Vagococcus elongatus]